MHATIQGTPLYIFIYIYFYSYVIHLVLISLFWTVDIQIHLQKCHKKQKAPFSVFLYNFSSQHSQHLIILATTPYISHNKIFHVIFVDDTDTVVKGGSECDNPILSSCCRNSASTECGRFEVLECRLLLFLSFMLLLRSCRLCLTGLWG